MQRLLRVVESNVASHTLREMLPTGDSNDNGTGPQQRDAPWCDRWLSRSSPSMENQLHRAGLVSLHG